MSKTVIFAVFLGTLILFWAFDAVLSKVPAPVFQWVDGNATGLLIGLIAATVFWNFGKLGRFMSGKESPRSRQHLVN